MTRPIKFRAYSDTAKEMAYFGIFERPTICYGPVEVMQFTGLLDKNGKEIWEGDVLKGRFNGVVEWTQESAIYNHGWSNFWSESEVIGNIYENPELIKN